MLVCFYAMQYEVQLACGAQQVAFSQLYCFIFPRVWLGMGKPLFSQMKWIIDVARLYVIS